VACCTGDYRGMNAVKTPAPHVGKGLENPGEPGRELSLASGLGRIASVKGNLQLQPSFEECPALDGLRGMALRRQGRLKRTELGALAVRGGEAVRVLAVEGWHRDPAAFQWRS